MLQLDGIDHLKFY